jgi:hypothetical protein
MYENGKMTPVKLSGMGGRVIKELLEGVNSTMLHCKNFVNISVYSQYNNNTIIKKIVSD